MLDIENSVLVVIDIQGKLASLMYQKEKFFENVVKMIKGARVLDAWANYSRNKGCFE